MEISTCCPIKSIRSTRSGSREGLARFAADNFILIPNSLALVWFRRPHRTHIGGKLPGDLLVRAFDHDMRIVGALADDPFGQRHFDRVCVSDLQVERLARERADAWAAVESILRNALNP